MIAELLFYGSLALLLITFVLYPLLTMTVAALRRDDAITDSPDLPVVSVIMPMYNEEKVIRAKTEALLALDYPSDRLEIILGSDCSDDATDEIAARFAEHSRNIKFIRSESRRGKAAMLNMLVRHASGELLAITDANVMPTKGCLMQIVRHFNEPTTGLCDAWPVNTGDSDSGISRQEKEYSNFEMRLKYAETKAWHSMTGPYGGFYVVRKELFPVIPEKMLADDLFVGLSIVTQGFMAVNEPAARVHEDIPSDIKGQYRRRVRIATGAFQNLLQWGPMPRGLSFAGSLCYFTHKVIRWFSPILFIIIFMTSVILSGESLYYFAVVFGQGFFIILPTLDILLLKAGITFKPLRYFTQFLMMNAALLAGLMKAMKGVNDGIWEPTQRV